MKITLICIGKIKEKYLADGIAEYSKRLSRFCELEIVELEDEKAPESLSLKQEAQVRQKEARRIWEKIKQSSYVIALDIKGVKLSSESFSGKLAELMVSGNSDLTFLIGGSLGIDQELLQTSNLRLSFSDMTFPHQLMRLILLEQLYRAFKIMKGETYHK